jgi:hypothetical protein
MRMAIFYCAFQQAMNFARFRYGISGGSVPFLSSSVDGFEWSASRRGCFTHDEGANLM